MAVDILTVRGTGEPFQGANNMLTHVTALLDPAKFRIIGDVSYPATVGEAGAGWTVCGTSENESVSEGVVNLANLIRSTPNTVGVLGYSLGAEVVSRFLEAQARGEYSDCGIAFTATIANPLRRVADSIDPYPRGYGINGQMQATPPHQHFECANPADAITSCLPESPLRTLADTVSAFSLAQLGGWTQDLTDRLLRRRWQPVSFGDLLHPRQMWDLYTAAATDVLGYPYQHTAVYVQDGYCDRLAAIINANN
ncbi:PE-PPE domain-containing protein [Nocardia sp. NBC_01388]|uniref:PE-PPE domain-containing protein n=1 Tax=Nocardia sp. NBC_01388 TaxID=2903596 RepID=UPI003246FBE5